MTENNNESRVKNSLTAYLDMIPLEQLRGIKAKAATALSPYIAKLEKRSSLEQRLITAAILIPIALFAEICGGILFALFMVLLSSIGYNEWLGLVQKESHPHQLTIGVIALFCLGFAILFMPLLASFYLLAFLFCLVFIANLSLLKDAPKSGPLLDALGILYLGIPMIAMIWLRQNAIISVSSPTWAALLGLIAIVAAFDTGAYFTGRTFGGPKLMPLISPNKTWSGVGGGLAASFGMGFLWIMMFQIESATFFLTIALLTGITAQIGDLVESKIKRIYGKKDSGTLLPGHGGVLDRLDGYLFAAPIYAYLINFMGV